MPICGLSPCWKLQSNGNFAYSNKSATPRGISRLTLSPGVDGKTKITLKGKGSELMFPVLPLTNPNLRVQLRQRGSALCWDAGFSVHVLKNKADGYTAQSD